MENNQEGIMNVKVKANIDPVLLREQRDFLQYINLKIFDLCGQNKIFDLFEGVINLLDYMIDQAEGK